ncbi:MAG: hypothetical protein PHZ00_05150 [Candidatus Peribacteraceae bacterium]|nr:hypothetical protein [Candidatus Peribacteraceae bacterium]
MNTPPPTSHRRIRLLSAAVSFLLVSSAVPVLAQESSASSEAIILQTVELTGTEQRTIAGENVLNDVIARDNAQLILARDADTGADTLVDGNALALDDARIFVFHSRVAGNVSASDDSVILIEQSFVDGNVEVNGNGIVAIDAQTVVSGDILGVFLGTDVDGYSIYVGL